jgi:hypothetical protein
MDADLTDEELIKLQRQQLAQPRQQLAESQQQLALNQSSAFLGSALPHDS